MIHHARDFAKIGLLQTAANAVSDSGELRKQFMTYANELNSMMKYLDRNYISVTDRERKDAIIAICDELNMWIPLTIWFRLMVFLEDTY